MVRGGLAVAASNGRESAVIFLYIWAAVVAISIITAVMFSCSDGASKSQTNDDVHPSTCAAGCGGGCGG
ncbi:hypothetical protein V5N11_033869 [Cardamine amara subsp. amara]|uniref:Transmembrane protein n=1 Tax=Cardamine amara subsp. amara TaxID=228776 RepID=A0ABD1C2D0_CARAN